MSSAELAILSLIAEKPRHGYEIDEVIEERGMRDWTEIGFSSIYYLLNKLENAQESLDTGNTTAAAGQIGAFINQVNALRNSGKLTDAQADDLIEKAGNALV